MTMVVLNDQSPCVNCGTADGRVFGLSPDNGPVEHSYLACQKCGWSGGWVPTRTAPLKRRRKS